MKTHTIKTYNFSELSEEAQTNACDANRDHLTDHNWWDDVYSDAASAYVQIESFDLYPSKISITLADTHKNVAKKIIEDHGPACETHRIAKKYLNDIKGLSVDEREDLDREFHGNIAHEYLGLLAEEYNYLTSDDALGEHFEANDIEFLKDGTIFYPEAL